MSKTIAIVMGLIIAATAQYDALPPGKYELSLQRRLDCCDGPTLESNKITFTVE